MIKIYLKISIFLALYVVFFMPSVLIYFLALSPLDSQLAKIDNYILIMLIKHSMFIIPVIPSILVIVATKLYRYSFSPFIKFRMPILFVSIGHLVLLFIIYIFNAYSQLAGWLSIPAYSFCLCFYGIGIMKLITGKKFYQ